MKSNIPSRTATPIFTKMVVSSSLLLSLVACDSSSPPDPFEILNPTWCEAATERNDEGVYSQLRHLSYDQNGNWLQTDWDYENDGSINARTVREYENDFTVLHTFDDHLEKRATYTETHENGIVPDIS